jgi:peptide/nickel transport system substrate-binding protein
VPNHDLSSLKSLDIAYDPDKAKQLLDEAGWKMGSSGIREKNGQQLSFNFVTTTDSVPQVDPLNGMLNKVGMKLNLQTGDFNFWIDNVTKKNYDMTLMSDSGYNSAGLIEEFFYSKGPYADYLPPNAELDTTIESAVNAPNQDEMWKNLFDAMKMIMQQVPGVMAWEDMYLDGAHTNLQDVGYNEDGFAFYYDSWISS